MTFDVLELGQFVIAKTDRRMQFGDGSMHTIWTKGQQLYIQGLWQWPGMTPEVVVNTGGPDHEHVPFPLFQEHFDLAPAN